MARPKTSPEKKLCKPIPVYLDNSTKEKVVEFTAKNRLSYLSNACRFIIENFFDQKQEPKQQNSTAKAEKI